MLIKIGNFEFTEVWDGVFYKKLSHYPAVSDWEKRNIIEFVEYEASHGRECRIECENADVLAEVNQALQNREMYRHTPPPALITECTACPARKGCVTEFVCHTTSAENAAKILRCGSLLSAIKARNLTVEELMAESRNAANDPADYFEYIMLAWGNCQAGDRLVMERKLGRFPDETDLSVNFTPGVRFYFRYEDLVEHPGCTFDGGAPLKTLFWRSARSFAPSFAYKNLEIHPVFLRFLTQNLKQNFWAPAQNLVFRGTRCFAHEDSG